MAESAMGKAVIRLRPAVQRFAEAMETILRDNDHKGSVTNVRCDVAVESLWREMRELDRAAWGHVSMETTPEHRLRIQKEAVDVANFALMVWHGAKKR
jgi:hypothetical protein